MNQEQIRYVDDVLQEKRSRLMEAKHRLSVASDEGLIVMIESKISAIDAAGELLEKHRCA